ncbi:MAG: hypothetical protein AB3A66_29325 (plasmid) [Nodularia sp. CChRGM 3473]
MKGIEAAGGKALAIRADSADVEAVKHAVAKTVNTIQPGPIDTDMNPAAGDTELDASVKEIGYPQPDTRPQRPPDSSECSQPWCR